MASPHGSELIAQDRSRLLGSVSLALFGQGAAFAVGLLCMILTTRLLGPEGYGKLALFFMALEVLSQVVGWPNLGLVRFGREELGRNGRLAETFGARVALFALSLGVAAGLLFLFRGPLDAYLGLGYAPHLLLLAFIALNETIFLLRGVFQTVSAFRAYAVISFAVRALNLAFLVILFLLLAWRATPAAVIEAQILSLVVVCLGALLLTPWRRLLPMEWSGRALAQMSAYSWPLLFGGLSSLVVNWVDLIVIKHYGTAAALGCYAVAYQAVTVLTTIQGASVSAVLPLLVSLVVEKRHEALRWYANVALPQVAWGLGLGCILLGAAAEALPLVVGGSYQPSVVPAQVLMVGLGFNVFAAFQEALARAADRVRSATAVLVALAALNVLLDLIFVPRMGILGAAVATTASFAVTSLLYIPVLSSIPALRGDGARGRWRAYVGLLPALLFAIAAATCATPGARLASALGAAVLWVAGAHFSGVFRRDTLDRLATVRMPDRARAMLKTFYLWMGR